MRASSSGLQSRSNLAGRIREYTSQGAVEHGDALIDGAPGRRRLLAGLKSHVIEQEGIGERPGVMVTVWWTDSHQRRKWSNAWA